MDRPLPYGWISQRDPNSNATFYVDTKANPPRSIWVHPLEDEQYLREHPEAREKAHLSDQKTPQYSAPPTPPVSSPGPGSPGPSGGSSAARMGAPKKKQGFLGKLKNKVVGTEEEREQERRHKAEQRQQMLALRERQHQEQMARQAAMYQQQQMYAQQQAQYAPQYGAPQYGQQYAPQQQQRSGFGGGGLAMPLLGGLAGGLLLGEAMDGFGGDDVSLSCSSLRFSALLSRPPRRMPALPSSLSPHICILSSPDLVQLLKSSLLPPLPHILQSFSPLPQVTTRTTSLTSVPHASFGLRFSSLSEIETACKEDEHQRAERTIDWIGARIVNRCSKWLQDLEKLGEKDSSRSPWWDELKRCSEGDHVPSKSEGWNHPVALIFAVSTTAPNPLQAITALHSRAIELPSWVDPSFLRYTLIIHPQNSPFSDEEAGALYNAVKKQFGLNSYLLPLTLPSPPPPPVPVPALIPRLPPPPSSDSPEPSALGMPPPTPNTPAPGALNTLRMSDKDIQQTARFTREFLVMSLIPWMEKCVVEWNENFSSNRRLPSRLFSSTRRLFGSPSPSPAPTHVSSSSLSRASTYNGSSVITGGAAGGPAPPSQQRRLAEFATILGDFRLAVVVWEALRKEGKGGSDMLPLLSAPSPAIPLHVAQALSSLSSGSAPNAQAQLRALSYAVRWEIGIDSAEFVGGILEAERWLVWAAGNAEEPPAALLLAHAALLSAKKVARRRAALWYLSAANRLEKCGVKPLTMYFLKKAHALYKIRPSKELSPSFWNSEGRSSSDESGFDAILSGIEHPLGRLLYTTGDVAGAIQYFLGLLRSSSHPLRSQIVPSDDNTLSGTDKVFLDDFRVAFAHYKSTAGDEVANLDLKLPFTFALPTQTRLRLPRASQQDEDAEWQSREEEWIKFCKRRGTSASLVKTGKVVVDEMFFVDILIRNPLDAEVNLTNVTIIVEESDSEDASTSKSSLDIEVIEELTLAPRESRTVSIGVKSSRPTKLTLTHVAYDFLSLLPNTESLAFRGKRLHNTPAQRQHATYAPDVMLTIDIVEATHKLLVNFVDDQHLALGEGETKSLRLWFANRGTKSIGEVWMVAGPEDELWVSDEANNDDTSFDNDVVRSSNSLSLPPPYRFAMALEPGDSMEVSVEFHAGRVGERELNLLFIYRENEADCFHTSRATQYYDVRPILDISASAIPCDSTEHLFMVNLEVENVSGSHSIHLEQFTALSPTWKCHPTAEPYFGALAPSQSTRSFFGASRWTNGSGSTETSDFVRSKLDDVLQGRDVEHSDPPPVDILYSHVTQMEVPNRLAPAAARQFIESGRRTTTLRHVANLHPHIPPHSFPSIFPLHNPDSVDFVVFWRVPEQNRRGHTFVSGITLGAGHSALKEIIDDAENAKVKRSMYAETQRQKVEVLDAIRLSEWNTEMNPTVVTQEEAPVIHDFVQGPLHVPVILTVRNYSPTHTCRFVLKFAADSALCPPDLQPPAYTGRLTYRGTLKPLESSRVLPKIWIVCPGTYALSGWRLETEVLEQVAEMDDVRVRQRYQQDPPLGSLTVSGVQ
ncbi:ER-golgi trafficking TRAPP I complex 85 kDa subunit-domain-containing protein [Favolaschia claudopus]|uniref:ER-golgi trafficking TRAPP I complex 85 kDa subunit-domain-containing protein n=1 Tax=Favolaschia claudopus TaxID=2862362 RepID=A0AAW0EJR0_9AGAR